MLLSVTPKQDKVDGKPRVTMQPSESMLFMQDHLDSNGRVDGTFICLHIAKINGVQKEVGYVVEESLLELSDQYNSKQRAVA